MIQAKCYKVIKDKYGRGIAYKLKATNGDTATFAPNVIIQAILSGQLNVENLRIVNGGLVVDNKPVNINIDNVPFVMVDSVASGGPFHLPSAAESNERARQFEAQGYTIYIDGKKMTANEFDEKRERDLHTIGACSYKYYRYVEECMDNINNIFFVKLGPVEYADFYC